MPKFVEAVKDTVNWDNLKCCGKKRLHNAAFNHGDRRSIVKQNIITTMGGSSTHQRHSILSN